MTPPSVALEALHRLFDFDLAARDLFHQLHARPRRDGRRPVDADLAEQSVEACPSGRVTDAEVALQLLHVSARRQENAKDVAVIVREHAKLARRETTGQLGVASRAGEACQRKPLVADGAVERRPPVPFRDRRHAVTRTLPIVHSMSRLPAPDPTVISLPD